MTDVMSSLLWFWLRGISALYVGYVIGQWLRGEGAGR